MSKLSEIKISTPTISETIPSTKTKVKMKPFRVGDEKSLLMASQSGDPDQIVQTLRQVISNCVEGKYEIDDLASFDLEYLFLKLRAFSVGENSDLLMRCKSCDFENKVSVDVSAIEIVQDKREKVIKIDENFGLELKFSKLEDLVKADDNGTDGYIELIARSVKCVYHGDEIIEVTEEEIPDLIRIVNELTNKDFEKISDFINNQPKVVKDVEYKCSSCGEKNEIRLEGLASFF